MTATTTPQFPGVDDEAAWAPGDPLYSPSNHAYSLYLYNFRDDYETSSCACPDRAQWPTTDHKVLPDEDELGDFIAEYRAWERSQQGVASGE